jgi:hypothetical protein
LLFSERTVAIIMSRLRWSRTRMLIMPTAKRRVGARLVLSRRELNRALLARQMLLRREELSAETAIDRLVGMQAQAPNPPYVGLWTRLVGFRHEELAKLLTSRRAVRVAMMRSTIHLVTAERFFQLRPLLQPVLVRTLQAAFGRHLERIDRDAVAAHGRALLEERPLTLGEIGTLLATRWRNRDAAALANVVRALVPLVQVPPRGIWGEGGAPTHVAAETWLGRPLAPVAVEPMIKQYLSAFGPATIMDIQKWSGLTRLRDVVERLRGELLTFGDDEGRELFDVPDAPRPDAGEPAPTRLLPEFDNVLLSYADHSRILAQDDRKTVFTQNGIIRATFLVDGFVAGTWRVDWANDSATLVIEPLRRLTPMQRAELAAEGRQLIAFIAGDAKTAAVQFAPKRASTLKMTPQRMG